MGFRSRLIQVVNFAIFAFILGCNCRLWGQIYAPSEYMFGFSDGMCRLYDTRYWKDSVYKKGFKNEILGKYGYINRDGKLIVPFLYEKAKDFHNGRALVGARNRSESDEFLYGFIDKSGEEVVELKFTDAQDFSNGMAAVKNANLWGYIDLNGKMVIPPKFLTASGFSEGFAAVQDSDSKRFGYIDKSGNWAIKPIFRDAEPFSDGLAAIQQDEGNMWGYIEKSGKIVIPFQNSSEVQLRKFQGGLALGYISGIRHNNDRYEMIDKSGRPSVIFDQGKPVGAFSEGLIVVENEQGKYGYAGRDGKLVVDFKYEKAYSFSDGLGAVVIDGKCGYINSKSNLVIAHKFDVYDYEFNSASPRFSDGLATLVQGIINKEGNLVFKTVNH